MALGTQLRAVLGPGWNGGTPEQLPLPLSGLDMHFAQERGLLSQSHCTLSQAHPATPVGGCHPKPRGAHGREAL